MRSKKIVAALLSAILLADSIMASAKGAELSTSQRDIADIVADEVSKNWEEYGVLPSVAVAQTFVESSLGKNPVRKNNLWGLRPGGNYTSYSSVAGGVHAYLKTLNNGRYDKALHKNNYQVQIREILNGGYYGEDDGGTIEQYYSHCIYSIREYGFDRYDKKLFRRLQKKAEDKRKKKWGKTYTIVYDKSLPNHAVSVDRKIIKRGTLCIWNEHEMQGIYDTVPGQKGRKIGISNPEMDGMKVKIEVNEGAKG